MDTNTPISRRRFLEVGGLAGLATLSGCQSGTQQTTTTSTTVLTTTTRTSTQTTTETTTEETTTTEEPMPPEGSINAVPADPDADYADVPIFDILDGDVEYELDLSKARERHYDNLEDKAIDHPLLQEFAENIDDEKWLKENIIKEYNNSGPENRGEAEYTFKWDQYKKDAPLDERIIDSNFMDNLWYIVEEMVLGDVSSTHKHYKAAVIQQIEEKAGKDTIVWGHHTGNDRHGLVSAITNPTYKESEFPEQETFVIETDDSEDPQASNLAEEGYLTNDNGEHPAIQRKDVENFWEFMLGKHSKGDKRYASGMTATDKAKKAFADFMLNPSTDSGQMYFDLMMIQGDMVVNSKFEGKDIKLDTDRIVYA